MYFSKNVPVNVDYYSQIIYCCNWQEKLASKLNHTHGKAVAKISSCQKKVVGREKE